MDEDLYPAGESPEAAAAPTPESEDEGNTALLPKSIFPEGKELKPGNKCTFEIVEGFDDEVLVKYSKSEDSETETEEVSDVDAEIDAMAMMEG